MLLGTEQLHKNETVSFAEVAGKISGFADGLN